MNGDASGCFGDDRLAGVGATLLDAVAAKRTPCLHRLAEDRRQTRRFANFPANPAAGSHGMPVAAGRQTNRRAAGRHILGIMDTTDVPFPTREANKRGFGMGLDRRPVGRMVRIHLRGIPAARAKDDASGAAPPRSVAGGMAAGKSFRRCTTTAGLDRGTWNRIVRAARGPPVKPGDDDGGGGGQSLGGLV